MNARDVMTHNPCTVGAEATVAEAAEILRDLQIRHLPVVRNGVLVGIVSDRDLRDLDARLLLDIEDPEAGRARFSAPVVRLMTADVIAADPETELCDLIGLMIETKVGAIPIVDPATRQLLGIVSYIDVLRAVQDILTE